MAYTNSRVLRVARYAHHFDLVHIVLEDDSFAPGVRVKHERFQGIATCVDGLIERWFVVVEEPVNCLECLARSEG